MRRWLCLFLLIALPVQFGFAGVLQCYQFSSTSPAPHMVQPSAAKHSVEAVSAPAASDDASNPVIEFGHCECGACHVSGAQPAASAGPFFAIQPDRPGAYPRDGKELELIASIDRPNWRRAA